MYTEYHKMHVLRVMGESSSESGVYPESNYVIDKWVALFTHPSSTAVLAGNTNSKAHHTLSSFFDKVYAVPLEEIKTKLFELPAVARERQINDRLEQQTHYGDQWRDEYSYMVLTGCYLSRHVISFLESASSLVGSRSVLSIDNWNDLYPQVRQGCYNYLSSSCCNLEIFLVSYNRAFLCAKSSFDYFLASLPNLKEAFLLHSTDLAVSRTSLEVHARHVTFFGPGTTSFDGYYGGLLSGNYEPFVQAQKLQTFDINAAFVFGLEQGLPLRFSSFIELLGIFASNSSTLKSVISTLFPVDTFPKSIQDKLSGFYRVYFMNEANHIYLEAGESSFLLFVSNLSLQNDSLGCYLIDIQDSLLFCWYDNHLCDEHTASLDYIGFLEERMDPKFFSYIGRIGLASSESKQDMYQKAFLHVPILSHIAHYVLNNLGPTLTLLSNSASWSNVIEFARLDYGYFTMEEEHELLSVCMSNKCEASIRYFGSVTHILDTLRTDKRGYLVLHGANVPRSLSDLAISYDASGLSSIVDTEASALNLNQYSLVIGVGIRGGTRECLNLADLVKEVSKLLSSRGIDALFILDGLGMSKFDSVNTTAALDLQKEISIASEIKLAVNSYANQKCISIIGKPLSAQLAVLAHCNIVLTHSGSSLVKYMWLLYKPTVIHGPDHVQVKNLQLSSVGLQDVQLDFHNAFRNEPAPRFIKVHNMNISSSFSEHVPVVPGSRDNYYMLNIDQVSLDIVRFALSNCILSETFLHQS
jgi:hypothetical protein